LNEPCRRGIWSEIKVDERLPEQQIVTGNPGAQPFGNEPVEYLPSFLGWVLLLHPRRNDDPVGINFDRHRDRIVSFLGSYSSCRWETCPTVMPRNSTGVPTRTPRNEPGKNRR
jgi:hypothetical protein